MSSPCLSAFDTLAGSYDQQWTHATAGRLQRQAVWRHLDKFVKPDHRALDLGCGTGEDALHLSRIGATVVALDASAAMVEIARRKGVDAHAMRIEDITGLSGSHDLVLSNFGAFNCVANLAELREPLLRLIRPGGHLAICFMARFCLWEFAWYAARGSYAKASRRWSGSAKTSIGLPIWYPTRRVVLGALTPGFHLVKDVGIGLFSPPSFVKGLPDRLLEWFGRIDQRIDTARVVRAFGDHSLLVFIRS
jgi:ubiquinone/menaquinone biosynthesis C-methylase UbiE